MKMEEKWTGDDMADQTGRIAIVTGANTGLGFETARVLAEKNAIVVMACRNKQKGKKALDIIMREYPAAKVELMELDLSSLGSVRTFVKRFKRRHGSLHMLINNAGVMMPPYSKTKEGYELQFGTNHLGHFALTGLLLDTLKATEGARVVNVSSVAHTFGDLDFDDLNWENRRYRPTRSYGDSKLANLYFTYEFAKRLNANGGGITVAAAHPGWTGTDLQRHAGGMRFLNLFFAQKPEMGALPQLYAAAGNDVHGGDYIGPDGMREFRGYPKKVESNGLSHDEAKAARLWEVSERLTGVHYDL
jgi:NAD(P)-dependent dehydrogenase (short-subunit alcohol dehydrogenase family)